MKDFHRSTMMWKNFISDFRKWNKKWIEKQSQSYKLNRENNNFYKKIKNKRKWWNHRLKSNDEKFRQQKLIVDINWNNKNFCNYYKKRWLLRWHSMMSIIMIIMKLMLSNCYDIEIVKFYFIIMLWKMII